MSAPKYLRAQPLANALIHLLRRLTTKRQQQDLLRRRFTSGQQPSGTGNQHRGLAAAGASKHQQRALAVHYRSRLRRVKR